MPLRVVADEVESAVDVGGAAAVVPGLPSAKAVDRAVDDTAEADEALIERMRGGDLTAGEVLVRRYFDPLMRYLQRLAGPQTAEELHQQTWVSVLDHLDKFDPAS